MRRKPARGDFEPLGSQPRPQSGLKRGFVALLVIVATGAGSILLLKSGADNTTSTETIPLSLPTVEQTRENLKRADTRLRSVKAAL